MRFLTSFLLIASFSICGFSQFDSLLHANQVNLLTVAIDYEDYSFSGASLNYYDGIGCTSDSLPFEQQYIAPNDFGSMTFRLFPSQETFFDGTIVWMGQGQQVYPIMSANTNPPYNMLTSSLNVPVFMRYFDMNGVQMSPSFQTDTAWNAVSRLQIAQLFAAANYDVICYLYAPSVGVFNPGPAKWLFFFYQKSESVSLPEINQKCAVISSNPVNDQLKLILPTNDSWAYSISSLTGTVLRRGQLTSENLINVDALECGEYFLLLTNHSNQVFQLKWVKI